MAADPEAAESILHQEDSDPEEHTRKRTHLELQTPVVENGGADDALCHIVGHTQFAIGYEQSKRSSYPAAAIEAENYPGHQHGHESEVRQRGNYYFKLCEHHRIGHIARQHIGYTI